MIWERWEEAARVIAKAGVETWAERKAGPPDSGVRVDDRRLPFGGNLGDNN